MKSYVISILVCFYSAFSLAQTMMFGDTSRLGRPFSKDPHVITFKGKYLMYYSIPPKENSTEVAGWGIGVAESRNLNKWERVGEITPAAPYEAKGLCAPCALVREDTVHLFYQTYGNGKKDAVCHAWSVDGINFVRNATNPVYVPTATWNCGRAIDAEVVFCRDKYYLYYATRTPDYSTQVIGVAVAGKGTSFNRETWKDACDRAILVPQYPWEGKCVEGPSVIPMGDWMFMFYAGAYNNDPQQIGVARSKDGIHWEKMSNKPFLANGDAGSWNYCVLHQFSLAEHHHLLCLYLPDLLPGLLIHQKYLNRVFFAVLQKLLQIGKCHGGKRYLLLLIDIIGKPFPIRRIDSIYR